MPTSDPAVLTNSLFDAMLLAATGGLLDGLVFLNHGHVFATAMTGNLIFLGIAAITQNWSDIIPRVAPLVAFFFGVLTSKHLRTRLGIRSLLVSLVLEIVTVFTLGLLPDTFPDMAFTAIIAYVAAIQVASFRRVDRFAFNSTFATGNLRDVAEGLYDALLPNASRETRKNGRIEARDLGLISLCFLAGAVLGAWTASRFANQSFWLALPLLIPVAIHCRRHSPPSISQTPPDPH
jgi:uncharacterized membrane protein YoaK (UPF0700 family)